MYWSKLCSNSLKVIHIHCSNSILFVWCTLCVIHWIWSICISLCMIYFRDILIKFNCDEINNLNYINNRESEAKSKKSPKMTCYYRDNNDVLYFNGLIDQSGLKTTNSLTYWQFPAKSSQRQLWTVSIQIKHNKYAQLKYPRKLKDCVYTSNRTYLLNFQKIKCCKLTEDLNHFVPVLFCSVENGSCKLENLFSNTKVDILNIELNFQSIVDRISCSELHMNQW